MAVLLVNKGQSMLVAMLAAILVGRGDRRLLRACSTPGWGCRRFVFSLAGLLAFQGALLYVLGTKGTINLPSDSFLVQFTRFEFLSPLASYVLVVAIVLLYVGRSCGRSASAPRPSSARRGCRWCSSRARRCSSARVPQLLRQHRPRVELPVALLRRSWSW